MGATSILMATYNGATFIRQQILSLQAQTHTDWVLYIRDDGSTDETTDLVQEIAKHDSRIVLVQDDQGNLGPGRSFFALASYAKSDYAIFCDQDDIWFERKLEFLLKRAKGFFDSNLPCVVYSDAVPYSSERGQIMLGRCSLLHAARLKDFLFFNAGYQGCSMLFNRAMLDEIRNYRAPFYMHDDVVSLLAHTFGKVEFLPMVLMLYRQHERNVTGAVQSSFWRKALAFFDSEKSVLSRLHYEEKRAFFEHFQHRMAPAQRDLFAAFLTYPERSLSGRLYLLLRYRFTLGGHFFLLCLKTLLRRPLGA